MIVDNIAMITHSGHHRVFVVLFTHFKAFKLFRSFLVISSYFQLFTVIQVISGHPNIYTLTEGNMVRRGAKNYETGRSILGTTEDLGNGN